MGPSSVHWVTFICLSDRWQQRQKLNKLSYTCLQALLEIVKFSNQQTGCCSNNVRVWALFSALSVWHNVVATVALVAWLEKSYLSANGWTNEFIPLCTDCCFLLLLSAPVCCNSGYHISEMYLHCIGFRDSQQCLVCLELFKLRLICTNIMWNYLPNVVSICLFNVF